MIIIIRTGVNIPEQCFGIDEMLDFVKFKVTISLKIFL